MILVAVLLGACASEAPEAVKTPETEKEDMTMNLAMNRTYGGLGLSWNEVPGAAVYSICVLDDGGNALFEDLTYSPYYDARDALAYGAQENEYYGNVSFRVQATEDKDVLLEETSEAVPVTDYFPEETEISLSGREVAMFVFHEQSSTSVMMDPQPDTLLNSSFSNLFGQYSFYGNKTDEEGNEVEVDRLLSEEEISTFRDYIRKGRYYRAHVEDPSVEVLDADSPRRFTLELEDEEEAVTRYFRFEPADSEKLISWIKTICHE